MERNAERTKGNILAAAVFQITLEICSPSASKVLPMALPMPRDATKE
jgi:hypothetical protein